MATRKSLSRKKAFRKKAIGKKPTRKKLALGNTKSFDPKVERRILRILNAARGPAIHYFEEFEDKTPGRRAPIYRSKPSGGRAGSTDPISSLAIPN